MYTSPQLHTQQPRKISRAVVRTGALSRVDGFSYHFIEEHTVEFNDRQRPVPAGPVDPVRPRCIAVCTITA